MCVYVKCSELVNEPSDRIEEINTELFTNAYSKKSKKDITCYKVLREPVPGGSLYRTVIGNIFVTKSELTGNELFCDERDKEIIIDHRKYPDIFAKVSHGFVQVFIQKTDAIAYKELMSVTHKYNCKIYKCVIPKNTLYFEGVTDRNSISYAASEIKFIEEV